MKRLIHSRTPAREALVLLNGDTPELFLLQDPSALPVGAVCLARVVDAKFAEIDGVSAFFQGGAAHYDASGRLKSDKLCEGDLFLVQVIRQATEDKEIKVTPKISLSSRYAVFCPTEEGVSVSRKIDDDDRERLKGMFSDFNGGLMLRTAAAKIEEAVLKQDVSDLKSLWQDIVSKALSGQTGVLYFPVPETDRILEERIGEIDEVLTDDAQTAARLKKKYPFVRYEPKKDLWRSEGLDEALEEALNEKVPLPSGGSLIVEETAACVCFDVNSGGSSLRSANKEAALEIPRQVLLKGLSGQMIVDFAGKKDKKELSEYLPILRNEKAGLSVWGITALGLVEMTRRGENKSLKESVGLEPTRTASKIVHKLWFGTVCGAVRVYAPTEVLSQVRRFSAALSERLGTKIAFETSLIVRTEGIKDE